MIQNTNWSSSSIPIENREVYEFVTVPSYVALASGDSNEPVCRGHRILSREYFLRDKYLKMERSRSPTFQKFSIVDGDVLIETA